MTDPISASTPASTSDSHARASFRRRLDERPLLLDGAMGTLLWSRGVPQRASLDELVLRRPELVSAIHREYIGAGVDIIETDTFGANRIRLAPAGLADRTILLNRRAAQLAREARDVAGRDVLVAGSVGPVGSPLRGPGRIPDDEAEAAVAEQVAGLLEGGVDLLMLETAGDLGHLLASIRAVRGLADLPVVACLTFDEDLASADGTSPEQAAVALVAAGVDAMGVNCGSGPIASVDALARMSSRAGDIPLVIMPNAGLPSRVEGSFVYAADAAYFGAAVPGFIEVGARLLGGCCGTTPEHVGMMRAALDAAVARRPGRTAVRAEGPSGQGDVGPGSAAEAKRAEPVPQGSPPPTGLGRALAEGRFVVSVEIDPPRSVRIERTVEAAALLRESGVDLVNISDSAMARVRMGALAVAFALQRDAGLECLVHVTTRDRNLMALESELLGAHALGIRDILALTGDPPGVADYPGGTSIWDIDSTGLIGVLTRLNRGEDQAGRPIGAPAGFTIACALDPTAADLDRELDRLTGKVAAGAHLIMTQPIFALEQWERFMERASLRFGARLPRPVLLGILPLHTARHAEFLHHEVPGITIPDPIRATMHEAGDRGAEVGLEMALELLERMRPLVDGTYIMPSFGRYELAAELVRRVRRSLVPAAAVPGARR
ncbi:bifunctional homocysteine S-methyltransferase/methylenetetrahydrofolate reductase [soil metagenome]